MEPVSRGAVDVTTPQPSRLRPAAAFAETLARVPSTETASSSESNFSLWWKETPRYESTLAAWERNPLNRADRGGRTQLGITERTFRRSAEVAGLPSTDEAFAAMSPNQARAIARSLWTVSGADQIGHPAVALVVFDWFWGSNAQGLRKLKAALQDAGHVVPESASLDPTTVAVLNEMDPERLVVLITDARHAHHQGIVDADPTQRVFLQGWTRRTDERKDEALAMIRSPHGGASVHGEVEVPDEQRPTRSLPLVSSASAPITTLPLAVSDERAARLERRGASHRR